MATRVGPAVWEKMFKEIVDHARQTQANPKSSLKHVVLRWAKKKP